MIKKHLLTKEHDKDIIYLYLDNNYEISIDFYITKDNNNLINNVYHYLTDNDISYKKKDIFLVIDNIIVAKLNKKMLSNKLKYLELIHYGKKAIEDYLEEYPSLKFIDLTRSNGIIQKMKLDNYLLNVIISEMPNVMEIEALKSQAVISRTYCYKRILENKKIKEINEVQIYKNNEELKKLLDTNYDKYINLVKQAIKETDNEIIKYNNNPINCYTHYKNTGKTEDAYSLLNKRIPYLKSVKSPEKNDFLRYRKISNRHLSSILGIEINKKVRVQILEKTKGNNNKLVLFNNVCFDGIELAKKLSLISYNYDILIREEFTIFVVKGCGINLGLSKSGASIMAKNGQNYKEILNHYYANTYIEKIS